MVAAMREAPAAGDPDRVAAAGRLTYRNTSRGRTSSGVGLMNARFTGRES